MPGFPGSACFRMKNTCLVLVSLQTTAMGMCKCPVRMFCVVAVMVFVSSQLGALDCSPGDFGIKYKNDTVLVVNKASHTCACKHFATPGSFSATRVAADTVDTRVTSSQVMAWADASPAKRSTTTTAGYGPAMSGPSVNGYPQVVFLLYFYSTVLRVSYDIVMSGQSGNGHLQVVFFLCISVMTL
eukprot:TRINITY_DN2677_c0_g1_i1.p1 TRINITY_DN2677_c0_g1~~TRINITY_DN2677_c0_g1_i1.p1  ORF type:complete len:185 (-),score=6.56 TRINITY_DN2677_c0_g1_i1:116-670(-)